MNNEKTVWEEFDKEFGNLGNFRSDELGILNFDASKLLAIKTFIRSHFVSKAEMREKIERLKPPFLWSEDIYQHNRNLERENTIGEILALLNEQTP